MNTRVAVFAGIILSICFALHAHVSYAAATFTLIPTSNVNRALGEITGVSDAWHANALGGQENPALCSLHDGLQWGMTRDQWFDGSDVYLNSSYITLGYHGFGVSLPMPNPLYSDFTPGTRVDYGDDKITDMDGNYISSYHSYDDAATYSLSIDIPQAAPAIMQGLPSLRHLSLGLGITHIKERYYLFTKPSQSTSMNFGALLDIDLAQLLTLQDIECEGSFGIQALNITNRQESYDHVGGEQYQDPLPDDTTVGLSLHLAKPLQPGSIALPPDLMFPGQHLFSGQCSFANMDGNASDNINGYGLELGFLDMLYGRIGYYDDSAGNLTGMTEGLGLSLHILQNFNADFNYSWIPGGTLQDTQHSWDLQLGFDYIKALHL